MIAVLRLSHRRERDKRVTTHCALVSRAFGADKMLFSGDTDDALIENIMSVANRFGGSFVCEHVSDYKKLIRDFSGKKIHLTMYGISVDKAVENVKEEDLLIVVGGEKVPAEVYKLVDYNVSVTNQPHSEIAALAICLDRYFSGSELEKRMDNWKIKIEPSNSGKIIRKAKSET